MTKFDVCWWADDGGERRIPGIEMQELPRRGDYIDLVGGLPEDLLKVLAKWYPDAEDVARAVSSDQDHELVVQRVVHRTAPNPMAALVHAETGVGSVEVWVNTPGSPVCPRCGLEVVE